MGTMTNLKIKWFFVVLIVLQLIIINIKVSTGEALHNFAWFTIGMFAIMAIGKPDRK